MATTPESHFDIDTQHQIDRTETLTRQFEVLLDTMRPMLDEAFALLSALDLVTKEWPAETPQAAYDAYDEATGHGRLYNIVADIHQATDPELRTGEVR